MKTPGVLLLLLGTLSAQVPNPTQQPRALTPADTGQPMPIFRVTVVSRTTKAINYHHRTGSTRIDFRGTELMPAARGEAKVESQMGSTKIETRLEHMTPPAQYGPEYMTYVLWGITPEGRAKNLGEVVLDGDHASLLSTTDMQTFGMIVTAEPYFAVTQPSDVVVAENIVRNDTQGRKEIVEAKYELLKRGSYVFNPSLSANRSLPHDYWKNINLYEARNAVQIAQWTGADKYAADTYQKAQGLLAQAEDYQRRKQWKPVSTVAREAAQVAEDSRIITLQRQEDERLANERKAAADREAAERAKAEAAKRQQDLEAQRRAEAEQQRAAADRQRVEAEQARFAAEAQRQAAERERLAAERAKAEADAARAAADKARQEAEQQQALLAQQAAAARQAADTAERGRLSAEAEK